MLLWAILFINVYGNKSRVNFAILNDFTIKKNIEVEKFYRLKKPLNNLFLDKIVEKNELKLKELIRFSDGILSHFNEIYYKRKKYQETISKYHSKPEIPLEDIAIAFTDYYHKYYKQRPLPSLEVLGVSVKKEDVDVFIEDYRKFLQTLQQFINFIRDPNHQEILNEMEAYSLKEFSLHNYDDFLDFTENFQDYLLYEFSNDFYIHNHLRRPSYLGMIAEINRRVDHYRKLKILEELVDLGFTLESSNPISYYWKNMIKGAVTQGLENYFQTPTILNVDDLLKYRAEVEKKLDYQQFLQDGLVLRKNKAQVPVGIGSRDP